MDYTKLRYEVRTHTAVITFCTPEQGNVLGAQSWSEIGKAVSEALDDTKVHSILFAGEGKDFCAGTDWEEYSASEEKEVYTCWHEKSHVREQMLRLWNADKPVMAAVQGNCLGSGFELTGLVDLVIAAEDAVFGSPAVGCAMVPMPSMQWITGIRHAKEELLLGGRFPAGEAYRIGYVNTVVPREKLMETAMDWAHRLAILPLEALRLTKRLLNKAIDGQGFSEYGDWGWELSHIAAMMPSTVREEFFAKVSECGMEEALSWLDGRYRVV